MCAFLRCKNSEHNWKNPITETPFGLPNIGNIILVLNFSLIYF